ncbi:hypothetical protein HPB47_018946 [Ixodes persulcatus]|uniref:Uncharacterized protein n=1 Tax=Ixodes persulcatus TaxID=34615 RepID=A0AC60QLY9_IXOPE|nr:hypothetical protein HPB47_018946 [Ixodes persulcatus]
MLGPGRPVESVLDSGLAPREAPHGDNIGELWRQRRNGGVYETIRIGLERLSIEKSRKQVSDNIDNLNQTYRTKKKNQTTGSGKVTWPYYYDLHKFLGCPPVNDPSLVDDSLPGDMVEVDLLMLVLEERRAQRQELREARERTHRERQRQFAIVQESNDLQRDFLRFLKSKPQK